VKILWRSHEDLMLYWAVPALWRLSFNCATHWLLCRLNRLLCELYYPHKGFLLIVRNTVPFFRCVRIHKELLERSEPLAN
jgi:hypothetical protein